MIKKNIQKINTNCHKLIDAFEFAEKLKNNKCICIDVRTLKEYKSERILKDEINIDFRSSDFEEKLNMLDKDKKYLYHCGSGRRSNLAKQIFCKLNFNKVYELKGGMLAWKKSGFKTIKK